MEADHVPGDVGVVALDVRVRVVHQHLQEGRCKATWERGFKSSWREAGPPNHRDDKVDSDQ